MVIDGPPLAKKAPWKMPASFFKWAPLVISLCAFLLSVSGFYYNSLRKSHDLTATALQYGSTIDGKVFVVMAFTNRGNQQEVIADWRPVIRGEGGDRPQQYAEEPKSAPSVWGGLRAEDAIILEPGHAALKRIEIQFNKTALESARAREQRSFKQNANGPWDSSLGVRCRFVDADGTLDEKFAYFGLLSGEPDVVEQVRFPRLELARLRLVN